MREQLVRKSYARRGIAIALIVMLGGSLVARADDELPLVLSTNRDVNGWQRFTVAVDAGATWDVCVGGPTTRARLSAQGVWIAAAMTGMLVQYAGEGTRIYSEASPGAALGDARFDADDSSWGGACFGLGAEGEPYTTTVLTAHATDGARSFWTRFRASDGVHIEALDAGTSAVIAGARDFSALARTETRAVVAPLLLPDQGGQFDAQASGHYNLHVDRSLYGWFEPQSGLAQYSPHGAGQESTGFGARFMNSAPGDYDFAITATTGVSPPFLFAVDAPEAS